MIRHTSDPVCTFCEMKLLSARSEIAEIFRTIKKEFPDTHCSWTWRSKVDQDISVAAGKSHTPWPTSYHNKVDLNSRPCSHAVDIFQITKEKPMGDWNTEKCREIYLAIKDRFPFMTWGGSFRHPDSDHFQIEVDEKTGSVILPALDQ